jgi:hypothetical protein|tara:strand:- start:135 stop:380 length:246 start_codon:yes stop_codon:yes gene_type:complete
MAHAPGSLKAMERQDMLITLFTQIDRDHNGKLELDDFHHPDSIAALRAAARGAAARGEAGIIGELCDATTEMARYAAYVHA